MLITDVWNNYVAMATYQPPETHDNYPMFYSTIVSGVYQSWDSRYILALLYADTYVGVDTGDDNGVFNDYTIYKPYFAVTGEGKVKIDAFYDMLVK